MSNRPVDSYVLTTGTQTANTFTATKFLDGVYNEHQDAGGVLDVQYRFKLGTGSPQTLGLVGYVTSSNDSIPIHAYDWVTASWPQIGIILGKNSTDNDILSLTLYNEMVGSGVNQGDVYIRFWAPSGLTSATLAIDELKIVADLGEGYQNGAIWFDSNASNTNTEINIDGTSRNPVSTTASLITLLGSTGLNKAEIAPGSTLTLDASFEGYIVNGSGASLALGNQNVGDTTFSGFSDVTGIATTTGAEVFFNNSIFGTCTLPPSVQNHCGYDGTLTIGAAGSFVFVDGYAKTGTPVFDLGVGIGASILQLDRWSGNASAVNAETGDTVIIIGGGETIAINGTDGDAFIIGTFEEVIDNSSAAVNISQIANLNRASLAGYVGGAVFINTNASNTGTVKYVDGTEDNPVSTIAAARTIADSIGTGLTTYEVIAGSTIVLDQNYDDWTFMGAGSAIDLNGQSVSGVRLVTITSTGTGTGAGRRVFRGSLLNNNTLPSTVGIECVILGTFTMSEASFYRFDRGSAASSTAIFDFNGAIGSTSLYLHAWSGAVEIQNLGQSGADVLWITGDAELTINANCVGGTIHYNGDVSIVDNGSGITFVQGSIGEILEDTSTTLPNLLESGTIKKNTAFSNFFFEMVLASDHVTPAAGRTVTAQRVLDGGAYANVTGTIAEVSNGTYRFNPSADDTNGDLGAWKFSAADCDDTKWSFKTT